MTVTWTLRGYDRRTEFVGDEISIPKARLRIVRGIVPPREDDPTYVDPVGVSADQAVRLAVALGVVVKPECFDYFVESEVDTATFVAAREARLARA